MTRPLDNLHSIKLKIGVVIVAAVLAAAGLAVVAAKAGLPLWLSGIGAAAAALVMVHFLARGLTAPLREMAAAAHDMADGHYDRRVYTPSNDEVGELAEAFNRMAAELAAVDTERRELIANVSHELRTPISAMQAVMENIVDGVGPADPATMRTMLAQVERLGRLVTQLLDLSRLDARDASLETKSFAVAPLLQAAVPSHPVLTGHSIRPGGLDVESHGDRCGGRRGAGSLQCTERRAGGEERGALERAPQGGGGDAVAAGRVLGSARARDQPAGWADRDLA